MSADFRLTFDIATGVFDQRMLAFKGQIAKGATATMDDVLTIVKTDARADIARAGFSRKWQNALRVIRYPRKGHTSVDASVFLFHNIPYAGIFDTGATILGKPLLWIPLSTIPPTLNGRMMQPARLATILGAGSKLVPMTSPNGTPLLGARLRLSVTASRKAQPKISLATLRRGAGEGGGVLRTVPLFFGIRETHVKKKLSIAEICQKARDRIPTLYARRIAEALND